MSVLWNVYLNDDYNKFGGRTHLGYAGWHTNATDAHKEAQRRFPDIDASRIDVNRV